MPGTKAPFPSPAAVPAGLASHIGAIAPFGAPLRTVNRAVPTHYGARAVSFCQFKDQVCDTSSGSWFLPHLQYSVNGGLDKAANFIASRV